MGGIITSYRYMLNVIGMDLFILEELGGVDLKKIKKMRIFNLRTGERILMKFDV